MDIVIIILVYFHRVEYIFTVSVLGFTYGAWEWLALVSFVPMSLKQVIKFVRVVVDCLSLSFPCASSCVFQCLFVLLLCAHLNCDYSVVQMIAAAKNIASVDLSERHK